MIEEYLKKLGFDDKEILIYLEILKRGKSLPAVISNVTKINRATVYSILNRLKKKNLIDFDFSSKTKSVIALPINNLFSEVKKQKEKIEKEESMINSLVLELEKLPKNTLFSLPKIRFIDAGNLENFLYSERPKWVESSIQNGVDWWCFQDHSFVESYNKWLIDWYKSKDAEKFQVYIISNKSKVDNDFQNINTKIVKGKRNIKYFKEDSKIDAAFWVAGDYIIMAYTKEKPHYLIEIYNPVFAKNMREMIKEIWKRL